VAHRIVCLSNLKIKLHIPQQPNNCPELRHRCLCSFGRHDRLWISPLVLLLARLRARISDPTARASDQYCWPGSVPDPVVLQTGTLFPLYRGGLGHLFVVGYAGFGYHHGVLLLCTSYMCLCRGGWDSLGRRRHPNVRLCWVARRIGASAAAQQQQRRCGTGGRRTTGIDGCNRIGKSGRKLARGKRSICRARCSISGYCQKTIFRDESVLYRRTQSCRRLRALI